MPVKVKRDSHNINSKGAKNERTSSLAMYKLTIKLFCFVFLVFLVNAN